MSIRRREFLTWAWRVGGAALTLAAGFTVYESLRPFGNSSAGGPVQLGSPDAYPADSATYVNQGRLYVTNVGTELLALSQKCPHLGCRVAFCDSSGRFECACHGSVFDLGGEWVKGPAPRGMDQFPLEIKDDKLVADTSAVVEGPDRGADKYLTPPKGPSCVEAE